MTNKTKGRQIEATKQRNNYTTDQKEKARKYYLMGLNLNEISKLLDGIPVRTLEKWQAADKWTALKETENIKIRALQLKKSGKTYDEIACLLQINRTTVWRYTKEAKDSQQNKTM
jgi:uncharacterized protein YjcR